MFKWLYNGTQSQCLDCSVIQTNTTTDIDGNTMHVSKYFNYSVWFYCHTSAYFTEIINSNVNLIVSNTSVLFIGSVNATENGGTYECVAVNDVGFGVAQSILYVYPLIVEHPQDHLTMNGSSVILRCRAESFPYPQYQWQKYSTATKSYLNLAGQTSEDYTFVSSYSSFGDYRCMVTTPTINVVVHSNVSTLAGKCVYCMHLH